MDLQDRVAIVTGGGGGIGRGIALELAARGADVAVADIDADAARRVADEVSGLGRRSIALEADVSSRASTGAMMERALAEFGKVDILVNSAGVGGAPGWEDRDAATIEDWDAAYAVHARGIVHATESVREHMMERRSGKVVNIAAAAGRGGDGPLRSYISVSKAAAVNVSQSFAFLLAPFNINVNCICPGLVWTPLWQKVGRERFDALVRETTPLGREQTPEDVGKLAAFLCSERARNIAGQAINLSGGWQMN